MAREVVWPRAALDDLDGIATCIAADSPAYAAAVISHVLAVARSLSEFPLWVAGYQNGTMIRSASESSTASV